MNTQDPPYPLFHNCVGGNDLRAIPMNHVITGTCGKCGGPVIKPIIMACSAYYEPEEWCMDCQAKAQPLFQLQYGPRRDMK